MFIPLSSGIKDIIIGRWYRMKCLCTISIRVRHSIGIHWIGVGRRILELISRYRRRSRLLLPVLLLIWWVTRVKGFMGVISLEVRMVVG